jgi:hypothetical protein
MWRSVVCLLSVYEAEATAQMNTPGPLRALLAACLPLLRAQDEDDFGIIRQVAEEAQENTHGR